MKPRRTIRKGSVSSLHFVLVATAFGIATLGYAAGTACPSPLSPVPKPLDTSCAFIPDLTGNGLHIVTNGCDSQNSCVVNSTFGAEGGCFGANSSLECVPGTDSFPVVPRHITFNTSSIPWTCSCVNTTGVPPSNFTCADGDFGGKCNYYPVAVEPEVPAEPGAPVAGG